MRLAPNRIDESLEETVAMVEAWKEQGLKTIHLEIGDYGTVEARNKVLNLLGGVVSSLGMSYSELCGLSVGSRDTIGKACELAETLESLALVRSLGHLGLEHHER